MRPAGASRVDGRVDGRRGREREHGGVAVGERADGRLQAARDAFQHVERWRGQPALHLTDQAGGDTHGAGDLHGGEPALLARGAHPPSQGRPERVLLRPQFARHPCC